MANRDHPANLDFERELSEIMADIRDEPRADDTSPPAGDDNVDFPPRAEQIGECLLALERVRGRFGAAACELWASRDSPPAWQMPGQPDESTAGPLRIGRFEILRELGRGGHGVVFLAHDPVLQRTVALKVPRPEALVTAELRERFVREARTSGRLAHPNLLPVLEAGEAGPICYIVSTYCDGPTLADWIASQVKPVAPRLAAELIAALAEGVACAHRQGILHRDIKPSNILLDRSVPPSGAELCINATGGTDNCDLTPRLTDFGLAKVFDSSDAKLTNTGTLMGTPAYMAPEQATGRGAEIGPATDVYALGAILYEMLAGNTPHEGNSHPDTLRRIVSDEPRPLRLIRRDVSRDLEAIVLKCLEKDPRRRYAMATDLADDLRRYLGGEITVARPLGLGQRAARWARRKPAFAAVAFMTTLIVVLSSAGSVWHASTLSTALESANQARASAEQSESELREHYYVVDLKEAYAAYEQKDGLRAVELLEHQKPAAGKRDLRGYLWRHLWWLCHGVSRSIDGHSGPVYQVVYSSDGQLLASAGADDTIRIWDAVTSQPRGTLKGEDRETSCVAFAPDGKLLASVGDGGVVRLWDVDKHAQVGILGTAADRFTNVAISPDGLTLAAAGKSPGVTLWDLPARTARVQLTVDSGEVTCLAFSSDGRFLSAAGTDHQARIWQVRDAALQKVLIGHSDNVKAIAFSHDTRLVVTAGVDSTVRVWDRSTGNELATLRGHRRRVTSAIFSDDDSLIISAGEDGTLRLWEVASKLPARTLVGQHGRIWCLASRPSDKTIAAAGTDGTIGLWDISSQSNHTLLPSGAKFARGFAFMSQSRLLASLEPQGELVECDLDRNSITPRPGNITGYSRWWQASRDGSTLASFDDDKILRIWNLRDGTLRSALPKHPGSVRAFALTDDGAMLATGTKTPDAVTRLWDTRSGKLLGILPNDGLGVFAQVFTRDGQKLVVGGTSNDIHVWNVQARKLEKTLPGHQSEVRCLSVSPDGRLLASGSTDQTVRLWNTDSWRDLGFALHHPQEVMNVAFCPDEPFVASVSSDSCIYFWHLSTGEKVTTFVSEPLSIDAIGFSSDGRWLVSSGPTLPDNRRQKSYLWPAPIAGER